METIELFSAKICPFAHRCRLTLMEKHIQFELIEIDLRNKPSWYFKIHPDGAVPALRQGDFLLRESLVINEFLEELVRSPALLPSNVHKRAEARLWIDIAGAQFLPLFYRLLREKDPIPKKNLVNEMHALLEMFEGQLIKDQSGPFWFGSMLTLTDIAIYPWFERWPVLEHYCGLRIPGKLSRLLRWVEAVRVRPAAQKGSQSASFYIDAYAEYVSR